LTSAENDAVTFDDADTPDAPSTGAEAMTKTGGSPGDVTTSQVAVADAMKPLYVARTTNACPPSARPL
jgi:hypothetical protein